MQAPEKKYKRLFIIVLIIAFLLVVVGALTACEPMPPVLDTRCIELNEFEFIQIEEDNIGNDLQYILLTPDGNVEVTDKVYEGAMNYEYSQICYNRSDKVATTYEHAVRESDLKPEPTVITQTVTETITEYVDKIVLTHQDIGEVEDVFAGEVPGVIYISANLAWMIIPVTEYNIEGTDIDDTDPENPIATDWTLEHFMAGDFIIYTWIYKSHTLRSDEIWNAQIAHYREGILLETYLSPEVYVNTASDSLEDHINTYIENFNSTLTVDLRLIYNVIYPPEVPDVE